MSAWARPAVNLSLDLDAEDTTELPDQSPDYTRQDIDGDGLVDPGDGSVDLSERDAMLDTNEDGNGPLAPKRVLLTGSEEVWLTQNRNAVLVLPANYFYLRHEAQGGTTVETNCEGVTGDSLRCDGTDPFADEPASQGAMGWVPSPAKRSRRQSLYLLAAKDDYNGSNQLGIDAGGLPQYLLLTPDVSDSGYRLNPASTFYAATPFGAGGDAGSQQAVAVRGLDAFRFELQPIPPGSQVGSNISDFVFTERLGMPDLDALGGTTGGWLRFEHLVTRDFSYDATDGEFATAIPYDGERGSYVSLGMSIAFHKFPRASVSTFLPLVATP